MENSEVPGFGSVGKGATTWPGHNEKSIEKTGLVRQSGTALDFLMLVLVFALCLVRVRPKHLVDDGDIF